MTYKGFYKIFFLLILVCGVIFSFSKQAECLIAQETTQITVKIKAVAEWLNTIEMKLNQLKMLAQLPQSTINQIQGMKELLSENFSQVRSILRDVESITHFTDDIENMLKNRHPDFQAGLKIDDLKARNETRDKQLKQTFEAYLKALNTTAKDFQNDENTREKLLSALSNSEGQVQALQALGALLDHTSSIIARNEQTLQGFMTTFLETERDEIDKREQKEESILEAYKSLQNLQTPGKTFTPGFK
jgi:P-type conjugative transfer protein TrbJ